MIQQQWAGDDELDRSNVEASSKAKISQSLIFSLIGPYLFNNTSFQIFSRNLKNVIRDHFQDDFSDNDTYFVKNVDTDKKIMIVMMMMTIMLIDAK